jgi:inhibitor of cysteine peptidase
LQRQIKKKTITYGIAAVFLALILTTVVYNVGVPPYIPPVVSALKTFTSYSELENFLTINMEKAKPFAQQYFLPFLRGVQVQPLGNVTALNATLNAKFASFTLAPSATIAATPEYSTTNVQVAGVDEADIVKSDGTYLYVVSGSAVYILQAYPPSDAKVLSKLILNETYTADIYVNGNRLVVLSKPSAFWPMGLSLGVIGSDCIYNAPIGASMVRIYDISNRSAPVLKRTISFNGTLMGSRMIGDYVYIVTDQMATNPNSNQTEVVLPKIQVNNEMKTVQPTDVRYLSLPDIFYYFTTVIAVNVVNDAQEPTYETLLTGSTASMYVSQDNMYLTMPNTTAWINTIGISSGEETIICRATLDKENVVFVAQGVASGHVLNQYSMDEYNGYFRIATTTGWGGSSGNNLYVLNMGLNVVGNLSNIAPGERIYSARFMGDRCYLDIFQQVDPFYVIDVSNPSEPKILGYLKVPGFSGYLHPYDANHLIGVGKNATPSDQGYTEWYQGVQVSLFDVSNVSNPIRIANYLIGDRGSDTPVLQDPKAFLFNATKNLLVIPVSVALTNQTENPSSPIFIFPPYGNLVFQGAYVFNVSLAGGLVLKGTVTHIENSSQLWNTNYYVNRALYIGNMLYTVSNMKVKINDLQDLNTTVKTIDLN